MKLIFDSHLDLAFNALQIRRDLTEDISTNRSRDDESILARVGLTTVSLPELRRGGVAIVCATVMSRIDPSDKQTLAGMYTQSQCYGIGRGHAAYYQALEKLGELSIIRSNEDLDACLARWASNADPPLHPVRRLPAGLILTMESADPILNPDSVPEWHGLGLRMVSLAHYGTSTYSHGTGTEGGLLPTAKPLVDALQAHRIALDMTHLTEQAFWELLDLYDGPVAATHHNCRSLVPRQRQLTDKMIKAIAARDGVIGTACDVWMLDPDWDQSQPRGTQKTSATLEVVCRSYGPHSPAHRYGSPLRHRLRPRRRLRAGAVPKRPGYHSRPAETRSHPDQARLHACRPWTPSSRGTGCDSCEIMSWIDKPRWRGRATRTVIPPGSV